MHKTQIKKKLQSAKKKLTQRYIAKKLGVNESYVSLMLSGRRKMTEALKNLLKKYNIHDDEC